MDTWSEEHRHRCETRWCISQGREWFEGYIKGVAKERGRPAAKALLDAVKAQAAAGNTGEAGMWIEPRKVAAQQPEDGTGAPPAQGALI